MNYEASTHLSDTKFKRLVGAKDRPLMKCRPVEQTQASVYQKSGRTQIKPCWPVNSNATILARISHL